MNPIALPIAELKSALAGLGKVISKRSTLPVLSHVRIERTSLGHVELRVTDLDTDLVARLDTSSQGEPVAVLIPFEELNHTAKGCRAGETVLLASLGPSRIALKFPVAGQIIEHGCESLPVEEYPPVAEIQGDPTVLDKGLRRSIHEAMQCASVDESRLILNGAYLDVSKPKAHYVVGTDGRHLFSSNSFALPLKESIVIPSHRFLEWKEFHEDGDWTLRVAKPGKDSAPQFEIASSHWRFIARSIEGNYPNWRSVLPAPDSTHTTIAFAPESVQLLTQLIARMPNHDDVNFTIGLGVKERRLHLLGKSAGDESWRQWEAEAVKVVGADVTVRLNRHLLTKALRFGLLKLEIIDALTPVRFSAEGRQMIVMPLRPDSSPTTLTPPPASGPTAATQTPPPPAEQPKENPMPNTNGTPPGAPTSKPTISERPALETALTQVEVVRGDFRNAIAGLNKLADVLKQAQRKQKAGEKEVQSVRQTLRSLQSVRI